MSTTDFTVEMVLYDHQQHQEIYYSPYKQRNNNKIKSMGKYLIFFVTELIFLIENNTSSYFGMAKQFIKSYLQSNLLRLSFLYLLELKKMLLYLRYFINEIGI